MTGKYKYVVKLNSSAIKYIFLFALNKIEYLTF